MIKYLLAYSLLAYSHDPTLIKSQVAIEYQSSNDEVIRFHFCGDSLELKRTRSKYISKENTYLKSIHFLDQSKCYDFKFFSIKNNQEVTSEKLSLWGRLYESYR